MLRAAVKFLLITEAYATLTFAFGWWTVPVLSLVLALALDRARRPVFFAMICAAAGWLGLLLLDAARGPVGEVASRFGGVMHVPSLFVLVVTLLFPAGLAWSAAALGAALRSILFARRVRASNNVTANAGGSPASSSAPEVAVADV